MQFSSKLVVQSIKDCKTHIAYGIDRKGSIYKDKFLRLDSRNLTGDKIRFNLQVQVNSFVKGLPRKNILAGKLFGHSTIACIKFRTLNPTPKAQVARLTESFQESHGGELKELELPKPRE